MCESGRARPDEGDDAPGRGFVERRRTGAAILAEVRRTPGVTRVEVTRRLGLSSAAATDSVARLREAGWLDEHRAPVQGRGRPTTCLRPGAGGPRVAALDLRHADWRLADAGLDGVPVLRAAGRRPSDARALAAEVAAVLAGLPARPRALGLAVPAPLADDEFVAAGGRDWSATGPALVEALRHPDGVPTPVLRGNDATLAGLAEACDGAAAGMATALCLTVEVGLGGTLLVDGRPLRGAHGAAGEFGHLPFGDPTVSCPCGAHGCWGPEVDGTALARHLGAAPSEDPRAYADAVLRRAGAGEAAATGARERAGAALGRGVAGLVNAHDPDVVVLGGLAGGLRGSAFDAAFSRGLMGHRRAAPPPVRDAVHGDAAVLRGAVALALDHVTSPEALAREAAAQSPVSSR